MKKTAKKLSLSRETLRSLEETALQEVAGGVTKIDCSNTGSCVSTTPTCVFC
ncbi:MAG TPA: class I lanthipeptide [Thermoanaerobaculia bacterium]